MESVPRIMWGPTSENVLDVGWPLDNTIPRRKQRPGSRMDVFPSGARESLITGRDYAVTCEIGWIPRQTPSDYAATPWSGPTGVEDFLTWCEDGNSFVFIPDILYPTASVAGCYLDDPASAREALEPDSTFRLPVTILHPTIDLHLRKRGILFEYVPGARLTDPVAFTFARADAVGCAIQVGRSGLATLAAANVLRSEHYIAGVRHTLLEGSRVNLVENGDYEADIVGSTALTGSTVAYEGSHPFRGSYSCKVTTANSTDSGVQIKKRDGTRMAVAAATAYSLSGWIYAPAASAGKGLRWNVEWFDGGGSLISRTTGSTFALAAGFQYASLIATSPGGAATAYVYLATDAANGVFNFWLDVVQLEAGAFPSSGILTGTASRTRARDSLTQPITWDPMDITVVVELARPAWADLAGSIGLAPCALAIGDSATNGFWMDFDSASRTAFANVQSGDAKSVSAAIPAGASLVIGAQLRNCATAPQVQIDVGAGFGGFSAACADPLVAWAANTIRPGGLGTAAQLFGGIKRVRVVDRLLTTALARAR